jgi:hypothetical protein
MAEQLKRRPWSLPRPSTVILLAVVAAMFVWACFAERGATACDWWCLSLLGQADRGVLDESADIVVYVHGLPFAFLVDREWGGWPKSHTLLWLPLVMDLTCAGCAMLVVARAWRWWLAPDGGRRQLRFHLSTAVALMFVAGVVLWANIAPSYERRTEFVSAMPGARQPHYERVRYYGWPLQYWETDEVVDVTNAVVPTARTPYGAWFGETRDAVVNLVYDVVSGLVIVLLTGVACEAWILKRAKIGKERATS